MEYLSPVSESHTHTSFSFLDGIVRYSIARSIITFHPNDDKRSDGRSLGLRDLCVETADKLGIPYQFDFLERGGTDSGVIHLHRHGVPGLVIAVPTRHIHSHAGIMHRENYDHATHLVIEVVKRLDVETVRGLTEGE
jgi:putative aminopeptidase FrvX